MGVCVVFHWLRNELQSSQDKRTPLNSTNEFIDYLKCESVRHFQVCIYFAKNEWLLVNNNTLIKEDHIPMLISVIACINNYDKFNSLPSLYFKLGGCDLELYFYLNIDPCRFTM